jgi:flagellin-like protein
MSKFLIRLQKNQKKGISPVISTIILIVVALVIALLVGVFAFGLFTSQTKSVSLQSGNLYATGPSLTITLKNPGSAAVLITGVTVTGPGLTGSGTCATLATSLTGGATTSATCAPVGTIVVGNTFDYVVNLNNGQSISGSVVSQ